MQEEIATPFAIYRGGTSKAAFVDARDLPVSLADGENLKAWILAIFGSPDRRQIDGIGGADSLTSKFAVVGPPTREGADVDYSFFQVGIAAATVNIDLNCGNTSAAVGPFAIDRGLVRATGDVTEIRVHSTNFGKMLHLTVETANGRARIEGNAHIDGVPGTGSPIKVDFRDMAGTHGGALLPTGNVIDEIDVGGVGRIQTSIIDLANLIAFVDARSLGFDCTEDAAALQDDAAAIEKLEKVRLAIAVKLGVGGTGAADTMEAAAGKNISTPWLVMVAPPAGWRDYATGRAHAAAEADLLARMMARRIVHKAFPATAGACTAIAAIIAGSVVDRVAGLSGPRTGVRIGHPCGVIEAMVETAIGAGGDVTIKEASIIRTARRLIDGQVYAAVKRLPWLGPETAR